MNLILILEIAAGVFLGSIPAALFMDYCMRLQSQHLTECLTRLNLIVNSVGVAVGKEGNDVVQAIERLQKSQ
jgi:hypothetical protein